MSKHSILVTQAVLPDLEEYVDEIRDIWESHWLTNMGDKHQRLENMLSDFLKVDYVSLFSNGHMALELLLQAMDLKGEVITTPFTFASTTHAIVRNGLTPVFCDINRADYTLDVEQLEKLITPKTSAIVPVHVYGNICNVNAIEDVAKRHNLKVVYDAAHAFGVEYNGRGISSYGDASMLSFHATKVFNTIEGGAVCFGDASLGTKLYQLKNFGIKNQEEVNGIGANAKMNEFQAAMGICNMRHIDENLQKREEIVSLYRKLLSDVKGIVMCEPQRGVKSNYAYMPIYVDSALYGHNRDELAKYLEKQNIYVRKYFYPLTCDFECYNNMFTSCDIPVAREIAKGILTLPLYAQLPLDEVERIANLIKNY